MEFSRTGEMRVDRIDAESGRFQATVFTDGEASDGHVLSFEDGAIQAPSKMPMFADHSASARMQLGSLTDPKVRSRRGFKALEFAAHLELDGEGEPAQIRRDVMHMIAAGHLNSMSGRWDAEPGDAIRRTELDPSHKAFVKEGDPSFRKRFGMFFKRWRALEGSVVGLAADPKALIARSQDEKIPECVRKFWSEMVESASRNDGLADIQRVLTKLAIISSEARQAGATLQDCVNVVSAGAKWDPDDFTLESGIFMPKRLSEEIRDLRTRGAVWAEALDRLGDLEAQRAEDLEVLPQDSDWDAPADVIARGDDLWSKRAREVQTVLFSKRQSPSEINDGDGWTAAEARGWLDDHDMVSSKLDETENTLRFRQFDPEECEGEFSTLTENMPRGVRMVACNRRAEQPPQTPERQGSRPRGDGLNMDLREAVDRIRRDVQVGIDDETMMSLLRETFGPDMTRATRQVLDEVLYERLGRLPK